MKKYFKQLKANKKGFTLIEMIVVIAIIGVLAAVLVPSMSGYLSDARSSKTKANARTVYTAAQAAVTSLEGEVDFTAIDSYTKPETNTGDTSTEKLFKKIEDLIGPNNYSKIKEITVTMQKGSVTQISIKENEGDTTVSYPSVQ